MPKPKKPKAASSSVKAANKALDAAAAPPASPGAVWSNNHQACNMTWWWLVFLKQIDKAFPAAENIKMNQLHYWNDVASGDAREVEAQSLADMLIKGFRSDGAVYEPGFNYASALLAMTKVLTDETKTVGELAAVNDELFLFYKEEKPTDLT